MTSLSVGEKIRKVRELKGLSQEYVAGRLKISQKAYSDIERGKTKLDFGRVEKIAEALEIEPISIITFDEKILFNNYNHATQNQGFYSTINTTTSEKELVNGRIEQLEKENTFLKEEILFLRSMMKDLTNISKKSPE